MGAEALGPIQILLTQADILDHITKGIPVALPPIQPNEPPDVQARRAVSSHWITDLAPEPGRKIEKPIVLSGVIVEGPLDLKYATFSNNCSITNSVFDGDVDLSFAVFEKMACFEGTTFTGRMVLSGAEVKGDLELNSAIFTGDFEGRQLSIKHDLSASGATFQKVSLNGLIVEGGVSFYTLNGAPARFQGVVSFAGSHIHGLAAFCGAQFSRTARFDLAQFDGGAFFNKDTDDDDEEIGEAVLFHEGISFIGAAVKMQLNMIDARFENSVDFDGLNVTGDAHFENASFGPAPGVPPPAVPIRIGFPGISVTGQTIFEDVSFDGTLIFHQSNFQAETLFGGAQFQRDVKFDGVRFTGPLFFTRRTWDRPARFLSNVSFLGAVADHDVYFRKELTDAAPQSTPPQFTADTRVDFRGFVYSRIYIAWEEVIGLFEPFDMQPYRQMESVFQTMGKDKFAGQVYLTQRWRSFWYNLKDWRRWLRALTDFLYWAIFNFGVKPMRLFAITAVLLCGFAWVFSQPNAVTPDKDHAATVHAGKLTFVEGLGVSFNFFMPFAVPIGSGWQATDKSAFPIPNLPVTFAFLATLDRLLGWLFVPIGAAVFSGLVRQQKK